MNMREAVYIVLTGREMARRVGHQFIMDDAKLRAMGFSQDQVYEIRRHALEIDEMIVDRMSKIPGGS